jgi:peroxiredoxin
MRNTFTHLTAFAVVLALFAGTAMAQDKAEIGQPAPQFTLKDQDGKEVSLSDYAGKVVVLEWFNIECPYVVRHHEREKTMPTMATQYGEKGVVWLAINSTSNHNVEHNKRTHERLSMVFPVLDDHDGKIGRTYGATHTPHMYVINTDGVLVYGGAIDDDPRGQKKAEERTNYAAQALDATLAGETVSTAQTRAYGCTVKY